MASAVPVLYCVPDGHTIQNRELRIHLEPIHMH